MSSARRGSRATLALAAGAFAAIGLPVAALGVAWPTMRVDLGRSLGDLGIVTILVTVGFGLTALVHGTLVRHLRPGTALTAAGGLYAIGCVGFATSSWPALLAGAVLLGAAAGEMESGINSHVAARHGTRAMNVVHGSFGVGAAAGPLVATELLDVGAAPQVLFAAVAGVGVVLTVGFALTRHRWVGAPRRQVGLAPPTASSGRLRAVLAATLVVFLAYVAVETATGQWSYALLTESRGIDSRTAGWVVSGFWAALTLGRFAIGAAGDRVTALRVLDVSAPAALVVALAMAVGGPALTAMAVVAAGLCFAGVFPAMVTLTPARFGADRAGAVMGWQLAAGSIGVGLGPAVTGIAVEASGPAVVGAALTTLAAVLLAAHLAIRVLASAGGAQGPGTAEG